MDTTLKINRAELKRMLAYKELPAWRDVRQGPRNRPRRGTGLSPAEDRREAGSRELQRSRKRRHRTRGRGSGLRRLQRRVARRERALARPLPIPSPVSVAPRVQAYVQGLAPRRAPLRPQPVSDLLALSLRTGQIARGRRGLAVEAQPRTAASSVAGTIGSDRRRGGRILNPGSAPTLVGPPRVANTRVEELPHILDILEGRAVRGVAGGVRTGPRHPVNTTAPPRRRCNDPLHANPPGSAGYQGSTRSAQCPTCGVRVRARRN